MPAGMSKIGVPPSKERRNYTLLRRGVQVGARKTGKKDKMPVIPASRQDGGSPYGRDKRDRSPRGDGSGLCRKGVYGADTAIG